MRAWFAVMLWIGLLFGDFFSIWTIGEPVTGDAAALLFCSVDLSRISLRMIAGSPSGDVQTHRIPIFVDFYLLYVEKIRGTLFRHRMVYLKHQNFLFLSFTIQK